MSAFTTVKEYNWNHGNSSKRLFGIHLWGLRIEWWKDLGCVCKRKNCKIAKQMSRL